MTEFTTDSIYEALRGPLSVIDDQARREQTEAYIEAARTPLERSVFDLLSLFSEAVTSEVSAHYQVGLSYRPGVLELNVSATEPAAATEEVWSLADGEVEKITLRIPAELKELATDAAAKAGLSVNSWFVRVLARALRSAEAPEPPEDRRRGRRGRHSRQVGRGQKLTGWVGPDPEE